MAEEKVELKEEFFRIYASPEEMKRLKIRRGSLPDFVEYFKGKGTPVSYPTLSKWKNSSDASSDYDLRRFLDDHKKDIGDSLLKIINSQKPNPKALELAVKILEVFNQEEKKVELSAGEKLRIGLDLREQLKSVYRDNRFCPICNRPFGICEGLSLDSKQEHRQNGQVGSVGLSS